MSQAAFRKNILLYQKCLSPSALQNCHISIVRQRWLNWWKREKQPTDVQTFFLISQWAILLIQLNKRMCQSIWRRWVESLLEPCLVTNVAFTSSQACRAHSWFQGRVWKLLRLTTMFVGKNYFQNVFPLFNNQEEHLSFKSHFSVCFSTLRSGTPCSFPEIRNKPQKPEKRESFSWRSVIINVLLILLDVVTHAAGGQTQNVSGFSFVKTFVWN